MGKLRRSVRRASLLALLGALGSGCVTVAEHRKLEQRVNELKARGAGAPSASVADLRSEIASLREEVSRMEGRLEVAEHGAQRALGEAQQARREAARGGPVGMPPGALEAGPTGTPMDPTAGAPPTTGAPATASAELRSYRSAYDAWSRDETEACIDRFGRFLQTYPSSVYADDAAYWLADCYFKQGDYRNAVLRFDDVVRTFPQSEKAAEALYRQGESLLRLNQAKAAQTAFQRVVAEYPGSPPAMEARRQLELMGAG